MSACIPMKYTPQKVLVTGGAGFIGSHLVPYLMEQGCTVTVLDNLSAGDRQWLPEDCRFIMGDVTDPVMCKAACQDQDVVFHLAAMSRVGSSMTQIEACTHQNVIGTLTLLEAARQAGIQKVIYPGSSSYYGNQAAPQHEGLPPQCLTPYALTKYMGELYCQLYTDLYKLPTLTLRLFNVYGARQPKTGDDALVVGAFFHQKKNQKPLQINGDGAIRRDFIYVKDVARIFWMAAQSPLAGTSINVGSGKDITILDLASLMGEPVRFAPPRVGDAQATCANIDVLKMLFGPVSMTSLSQGLSETWKEEYDTASA